MTHEQLFEEMEKRGAVENLVAQQVEWSEEGQTITGILVSIETVHGEENDFKVFTFDTSNGLQKCTLGVKYDKLLTESNFGGLYRITYLGKQQSSKNRLTNEFSIRYADAPPDMLKRLK